MRRLLSLVLLSSACGGELPGGSGGVAMDYFPLAVGARWTYANLDDAGGETTLIKEITRCEDVAFLDCVTGEDRAHVTYVQETTGSEDAEDSNINYLEANEDGIVRVQQDFVSGAAIDHYVTYSPSFVRLFDGPYGDGREESFEHARCEYDATGLREQTTRNYLHRVIGREEVTVEAGTYDALVIERVEDDGDTKRYYYALGVGKVLEEDFASGTSEELQSFVAGEGSCP